MISRTLLILILLASLPCLGMKKSMPSSSSNAAHRQQQLIRELLKAARNGALENIKKIVAMPGIDINATDSKGNTALHLAVTKGNSDMVTLLIRHGARLDAQNARGNTALHLAAHYFMHNTNLELLTKAGAHVNIQNFKGDTPLHTLFKISILESLFEFDERKIKVAHLLEKGARIDIQNTAGNPPCNHQHEFIRDHIYDPCIKAIVDNNIERVQELLKQGANVNFDLREIMGNKTDLPFLLDVARSYKKPEIMRLLLDAGADPLLHTRSLFNAHKYNQRMALVLLTHVPKPLIRNTWNAITATTLLCIKYKWGWCCKDVRSMLRDYYVTQVIVDTLHQRAQKLCQDLVDEGGSWNLETNPTSVDQYHTVWQQQIKHAIVNRPRPSVTPKTLEQQKL